MKLLGIIILIVGLVLTLYTGFTYITKEKIVDVGNLEITTEKEHAVNWKPYLGFGVMAIGAVVLVLGRKNAPAL